MTTTKKVFIVLGSAFGLCVLGWIALVGAVYALGGVMTVRVDNPTGPDLSIPVPVAVVGAALATGESAFRDIELHFGDLTPMLREMLEVIDECPDVTFVDVQDRGESVRIYKEDGYLRVEVHESGRDGVNVEVSMPTRSIARLVS